MPSEKKGKLWYPYFYFKRKKISVKGKGYTLKRDAENASEKAKSKYKEKIGNDFDDSVTLERLINLYLEYKTFRKESTKVTYEQRLKYAQDFDLFKGKKALDIKPWLIEKFEKDLKCRHSDNFVRNIIYSLKLVYMWALDRGRISENPIVKYKLSEPKKRDYVIIPRERIEELFTSDVNIKDQAIIGLAIFEGIRLGEVFVMDWKYIDFKNDRIDVRFTYSSPYHEITDPKSKAAKNYTDMFPDLKPILEEYWIKCGKPKEGLLFPSKVKKGFPINPNTYRDKVFYRILKSKNLPRMTFHDLRHSFVTHLLQEGHTITSVSRWVRHKRISTTLNMYAHAMPSTTKEESKTVTFLHRKLYRKEKENV